MAKVKKPRDIALGPRYDCVLCCIEVNANGNRAVRIEGVNGIRGVHASLGADGVREALDWLTRAIEWMEQD